jgi:hypothetical protein
MLYLKIIVQIVVGISALLAVALQYKWHDKRRVIFKKLRNALIGFTILSLVTGLIVTVSDEIKKDAEINLLQSKLDSAQNILLYIKSNGDTLNARLQPILAFVHGRYPNLSFEDAVDSLKLTISRLDRKTSDLNVKDSLRNVDELRLRTLMQTPPSITAQLLMDSGRNIYLEVRFINKVPINFEYSLVHSLESKRLSQGGTSFSEVYPPQNNQALLVKDQFNFPAHIPKNELSFLSLEINYESIYFKQSYDAKLKRNFKKDYVIDPQRNSLTERR